MIKISAMFGMTTNKIYIFNSYNEFTKKYWELVEDRTCRLIEVLNESNYLYQK